MRKISLFVAAVSAVSIISLQSLSAQNLGRPTFSGNSNTMSSRTPDVSASPDLALQHNKLIQQRAGDGTYKLIGTYKVTGTCFLFGEKNKGDVFSVAEKAWNIFISYNTYDQTLEFYSTANPNTPYVKEPGTLDSFVIQENTEMEIPRLKFVYGSVLASKDKSYFQEVYVGSDYSLYKKYQSELGYPSDNYAHSELRQFDLTYEFYYYNYATKELKKLKKNASNVVKEFKSVKDISPLVDATEFTANPEKVLRKVFESLNDKKGF